jgi:hypothetical protein
VTSDFYLNRFVAIVLVAGVFNLLATLLELVAYGRRSH